MIDSKSFTCEIDLLLSSPNSIKLSSNATCDLVNHDLLSIHKEIFSPSFIDLITHGNYSII